MNQTFALHRIEIAKPCTASWDKMTGDSRVRHCGDCNKNVFNLSAMPEAEAASLLAANTKGDLCVRFYRREDSTVMTSDCGSSPRAAVRQAWRRVPGMASLAFVALSAAGCTASRVAPEVPPPVVTVNVVPQEVTSVTIASMGAPPPTPMLMGEPVVITASQLKELKRTSK